MISSLDVHHIKYDIVQYCSILIISCIINFLFKKTELFNEEWNNIVIITLISVILSDIFVLKIINYCYIKFKINNSIIKFCIKDLFRYSSIYIFVQLTKNFISYNFICYTHYNFKFYIATLFGYIIYNIIYSLIPNKDIEYKYIIEDITKLSFGIISVGLFADNKFEYKHLIEFIIIITAVIIFHSVSKESLSIETINAIEYKRQNNIISNI
jgi:hypothetical protein